jgi:hypothetical protein
MLLREETDLVTTSEECLGTFVPLAARGVEFMHSSISTIGRDHFVIAALLIAMQKAAALALLSYLRNHTAQAEFNCRQLIEFCSLTAYLLAHPEIELSDPSEGSLISSHKSRDLRDKAHKWLGQKHPDLSISLLEYKKMINDTVAHASIFVSHFNFHWDHAEEESPFEGSFFDKVKDDEARLHLLSLCHLTILITETVWTAAKSGNAIVFIESFEKQLTMLKREVIAHQSALEPKFGQKMA